MASVTQLAEFLIKLNSQKDVARLAFCHWLENFSDPNSEVQPELIEMFYDHALLTPYWQNHQQELGKRIHSDLLTFSHSHPLGFEVEKLRHCHTWQTIEVEQKQDFYHILNEQMEAENPGSSNKFVALSPKKMLQVLVTYGGGLEVCLFANRMKINGNRLIPLAPLAYLKYNSSLDLVPGATQILQTSHLSWSRFQVDGGNYYGLLIKDYTFQKAEAFMGQPINQYPELYYALKQIERHFIDLRSDPLYQELVSILEKANAMVTSHHPEATRYCETALEKGCLALRNLFPNDRLLDLLVTNLKYRITAGAQMSDSKPMKPENLCLSPFPQP